MSGVTEAVVTGEWGDRWVVCRETGEWWVGCGDWWNVSLK